jgi:hypothetical protein
VSEKYSATSSEKKDLLDQVSMFICALPFAYVRKIVDLETELSHYRQSISARLIDGIIKKHEPDDLAYVARKHAEDESVKLKAQVIQLEKMLADAQKKN